MDSMRIASVVSGGAVIAATGGGAWAQPTVSAQNQRFTVIGLPDTQRYSESYPEIFESQTAWIADRWQARGIRFVSHYGDLVQHGRDLNEWARADRAMQTLDNAGVPYGTAMGNHDALIAGNVGEPFDPTNYLDYFGAQRFAGRDYYVGASPSGLSNAQVFSGGGREFLALHLTVETPVQELVWAQGVINRHRDKAVMVTTHRYLQDAEDYLGGVPLVPSGRYPDIWYAFEDVYDPSGIHAEEFFQTFVRTNRNIFLVNAGHFHEEFRQTSTNLAGLPVHEVLADYQDDDLGGGGFLRIMDFDVGAKRIDFRSYSPWLDSYYTADESQFSMGVDFDAYRSTRSVAVFQEGINGYAGTRDTWVGESASGTSHGNEGTIVVDDDTQNNILFDYRAQGLLRFEGLFGDGEGQIPQGATIHGATLRLWITEDIDTPLFDPDFDVYVANREWSESSTWDSLNDGMSGNDLGQFLGTLEGDNDPDGDGWRLLDVTAALELWAGGATNFGLVVLPEIIGGNDDGIEIASSEWGNPLLRPSLEVTYTFNGRLVPGPAVVALFGFAAVIGARRRRVV
ncbi:MAG: DNRLRE domain-containing protein [Phycisphaeraceae bacterium]|nr:DNRLRE domain-containing protein [Phycisphaeraceae bacterium]